MKLLRAGFQNFRMLRDLELDFSINPQKKLTVIRAANESGKTTILYGLQWALYGDAALPGKGKDFRLYPIDWDVESEGTRVPITATVEFEQTTWRRASGVVRETNKRYRLVRSVSEYVDSSSSRSASTVKLFLLNDTGAAPIEEAPDSIIDDALPLELREIFFTDGDRALSFIEADGPLSAKRERVQRAIRSLLGLSVIEEAIKHVDKSAAKVNKKAKKVGRDGALSQVASRLEAMENDRVKLQSESEDAKQQFKAFNEKVHEMDRKIEVVLQKGDKEELKKDLDQTRREIKRLDEQLAKAKKEHSTLFRSRSIATGLLAPLLSSAFEKLKELRGQVSHKTVPALQDWLSAEICICGEMLESNNPEGEKRRAHIQKLIDASQQADETQGILTDLYYDTKPLLVDGDSGSSIWLETYKGIVEQRNSLEEGREEAGRKLRTLEKQIDALPNTDIQGLRKARHQYQGQRDRFLSQQSSTETKLAALHQEHEEQEAKRNQMLREQKKGAHILAELDVIKDVKQVLQCAYERLTNEELHTVSELMNRIFIEMIGADPEQGALIRRAEISPEFDILVYGPNNKKLNPDRDLNGASRRALTLAFILALTKVSEIEALNVIDTPLGMTSGYVKYSILSTSVRESAQLILFLTHDEIAGCEEIIDEAAGSVYTLTNPAHYPKILVNDPGVVARKVLRCECDHHNECPLCQRRANSPADLEAIS